MAGCYASLAAALSLRLVMVRVVAVAPQAVGMAMTMAAVGGLHS